MFYVYKFVISSMEILSSIISMIIVVVCIIIIIIIVVVIIIQVNLSQTCLPSNVSQKIIYKRNINNL
jgi:hypothetical protein